MDNNEFEKAALNTHQFVGALAQDLIANPDRWSSTTRDTLTQVIVQSRITADLQRQVAWLYSGAISAEEFDSITYKMLQEKK